MTGKPVEGRLGAESTTDRLRRAAADFEAAATRYVLIRWVVFGVIAYAVLED
jgi:hypothetical protein